MNTQETVNTAETKPLLPYSKTWLWLSIIAAILAIAGNVIALSVDRIYSSLTPVFLPQALAQDIANLALIAPFWLILAALALRGSVRAYLLWLGVLDIYCLQLCDLHVFSTVRGTFPIVGRRARHEPVFVDRRGRIHELPGRCIGFLQPAGSPGDCLVSDRHGGPFRFIVALRGCTSPAFEHETTERCGYGDPDQPGPYPRSGILSAGGHHHWSLSHQKEGVGIYHCTCFHCLPHPDWHTHPRYTGGSVCHWPVRGLGCRLSDRHSHRLVDRIAGVADVHDTIPG